MGSARSKRHAPGATLRAMPGATLLALLAATLLASLAVASAAQGAIDWKPCPRGNDLACATLSVPLDPTGAVPGTISLALRRHRAAVGEARSAIVALAGGPGQAAIPFAEQFDELLGRVAATRDLIVFDQRGTGLSHPLSCHAFEGFAGSLQPERVISRCAAQLGAGRTFYTSADTVADIEAIRRAGGYEKLVLYGTSYGTKVAEMYAQAYPQHVEALVLDSVVTPAGPDTLNRATFAALPRVLRSICTHGACRGVTRDPLADLDRLVARLHRRPLRIAAIGPGGGRQEVRLTGVLLLEALLAGDFSGALRADFVTSVRAADEGDMAPLGRLLGMATSEESLGEEFDYPLYFATTCEEQSFPFSRAAAPAQRLAEALAAARSLPASTFAPFDAADAIALSDVPSCARWPYPATAATQAQTPQPPQAAQPPQPAQQALPPLPAVPTLILSGSEDLRTPTSNAREVAAEIPGSHLLVVPYTGHSVLGEDPSSCSSDALQALFAGSPIVPCRASAPPARLRPEPLPPRRLGALAPAAGTHGLAGRTAQAVQLTLDDLGRQLELHAEIGGIEALLAGGLQVGGLRSGSALLQGATLVLHDYSYVPGVRLDGAIKPEVAQLHVVAPHVEGTLRFGPQHALVGQLDGQPVRLPAVAGDATAIVGADASAGREDDDLLHPGGAGPQRPLGDSRLGERAVRSVRG